MKKSGKSRSILPVITVIVLLIFILLINFLSKTNGFSFGDTVVLRNWLGTLHSYDCKQVTQFEDNTRDRSEEIVFFSPELRKFTSLKSLCAECDDSSDLSVLSGLEELEELSLSYDGSTMKSHAPIVIDLSLLPPNIKELSIYCVMYNDLTIINSKKSSGALEKVDITSRLSKMEGGLSAFSYYDRLTHLSISCGQGLEINGVGSVRNVTDLELYSTEYTGSFGQIKDCEKLSHLRMMVNSEDELKELIKLTEIGTIEAYIDITAAITDDCINAAKEQGIIVKYE